MPEQTTKSIVAQILGGSPVALWAGAILIPITVAVVSLWMNSRIDQRQRELSEALSARQEQLTVTQTIDTYYEGVGDILLREADEKTKDRIIASRTQSLLDRLKRPQSNGLVVRFISNVRPELLRRPERELEKASKAYINLSGLDLHGVDLSFANLARADLRGANLTGVDLSWSNLKQANLVEANLDEVILHGADLGDAMLQNVTLRNAKVGGATLSNADMQAADLTGADLGDFLLDGNRISTAWDGAKLNDAIWIDGARCKQDSVGECKQ